MHGKKTHGPALEFRHCGVAQQRADRGARAAFSGLRTAALSYARPPAAPAALIQGHWTPPPNWGTNNLQDGMDLD